VAQVLIRQLDDQVVERLRQQARQRGISLEQSLRELLTQTAMAPESLLDDLARLRRQTPAPNASLDVTALIREGREQH
jgi:plasmid stability protein